MQIANCTSVMSHSDHTQPKKAENQHHYKNDVGKVLNMSFAEYFSTTWEFIFTRNNRTPDTDLPRMQVDLSHFNNLNNDQLNVTWLGHSSLMINIDGYKILMDPVFVRRVSLLGPSRFNGDVPLDIQQIPNIDAVIISHDHYDHLNKFSIQHLIEKSNMFIVPRGVAARLIDWGVPEGKIVELDWWQEFKLDQKLMVAATPSQHFSGRGINDRNKTLWASWVIQTPYHKVFFSGDSGYFSGFKQTGNKYGPFDMTFMECGAYGESWPLVHMFPEQTVQAHLDLKGNVLHPIHWGTFNLALHSWYDPMVRLTAAANTNGVKIATPVVGETTIYNKKIPVTKWWEQAVNLPKDVTSSAVLEGGN